MCCYSNNNMPTYPWRYAGLCSQGRHERVSFVAYRRSKSLPVESLEPWITPAILIAGFAFLWSQLDRVRRDVGELRERMARLEGLFEGFTKRETG